MLLAPGIGQQWSCCCCCGGGSDNGVPIAPDLFEQQWNFSQIRTFNQDSGQITNGGEVGQVDSLIPDEASLFDLSVALGTGPTWVSGGAYSHIRLPVSTKEEPSGLWTGTVSPTDSVWMIVSLSDFGYGGFTTSSTTDATDAWNSYLDNELSQIFTSNGDGTQDNVADPVAITPNVRFLIGLDEEGSLLWQTADDGPNIVEPGAAWTAIEAAYLVITNVYDGGVPVDVWWVGVAGGTLEDVSADADFQTWLGGVLAQD